MKKKFLVVGDNHLDSSQPRSRIDNYLETCLMELQETLEIAEEKNVDYYVLLGDLFNKIEVGGKCRNRTLELMSDSKWLFDKYVVVGNHDVAHNLSNLPKSALQTLITAGAVKYAEQIENLPVRFFHFTKELDDALNNGILKHYNDKILFMHASIVEKPMVFNHVLFDDLVTHPDTRLIFSGHIHRQMNCKRENLEFVNPGSVGRPCISQDYEKTKVKVAYLEYDFGTDKYNIEYIQLKYSLPYDVVFNIEESRLSKFNKKSTEKFLETISGSDIDAMSPDIIEDIIKFGNKKTVDKNVVDEVINTLNNLKTGGFVE